MLSQNRIRFTKVGSVLDCTYRPSLFPLIALIAVNICTPVSSQDLFLKETAGRDLIANAGDLTFPNIDYLAAGYNIFLGDPRSPHGIDPGFTNNFLFDFENQTLNGDKKYSIPHGVTVLSEFSCEASYSSQVSTSASEYQSSMKQTMGMSVEVSAMGGMGKGAFTGSQSFSSSLDVMQNQNSVIITSDSTCTAYTAGVQEFNFPPQSKNLKTAVSLLSDVYEEEPYWRLIDSFGTHYIKDISMGSRFGYIYTMTYYSYQSIASQSSDQSFSVSVGVDAGIVAVSASVNYDTSQSSTQKTSISNQMTSTTQYSIGAKPPLNGDVSAWMQQNFTNPMPAIYNIQPIDHLIEFYYNSTRPQVVQNVKRALQSYCVHLGIIGYPVKCDGIINLSRQNLAVNAVALQNRAHESGYYQASNAIDGQNFFCSNSMSWQGQSQSVATSEGSQAAYDSQYILLEFPEFYDVGDVLFYGRDQYQGKLKYLSLRVGNSSNAAENVLCPGPSKSLDAGVGIYRCKGIIGKYLFIQNSAANNFPLGYCEIEVYSFKNGQKYRTIQGPNLLKGKSAITSHLPAYQQYILWEPKKALDGWTCGEVNCQSMYISAQNIDTRNPYQWLNVDIVNATKIYIVKVYPRTSYTTQSQGISVWVGNNTIPHKNKLCGRLTDYPFAFGGGSIKCDIVGRYVGFTSQLGVNGSDGYISLAEVEAYTDSLSNLISTDTAEVPQAPNLLFNKSVNSSTVQPGSALNVASYAVDGSYNVLPAGGCFVGASLPTQYLNVNMNSTNYVEYVKVAGRLDSMTWISMADNYQIYVGNSTNILENVACNGGQIYNGSQVIPCQITGQYVGLLRTQISGIEPQIMICEIQAFSY
eukprot:403364875